MRFTILEEMKSTLPKSLFCNYYSQIKSNQKLVFDERGNPEYPGKNLLWQSRECRTGGSLARFMNLKNRGARFMDIKKIVFPNHESKKVRSSF